MSFLQSFRKGSNNTKSSLNTANHILGPLTFVSDLVLTTVSIQTANASVLLYKSAGLIADEIRVNSYHLKCTYNFNYGKKKMKNSP